MPNFTEESVQRIIINPFYAITLASQLTEEHEPAMDEAEWVCANSSLIGEMGAARWPRQLLDVLEGKAGTAGGPIDPSQAINIDPLFAVEHPPLIEREMWVEVNVMHIRNMGAEGWLRQLLEVLNGDIVTAEEVGFTPPGGPFGYGAPGRLTVERRVKKRRNKRRRAEAGAYESARPNGKQGESTTPQKRTAVYVYATRQDPPGNLADQLITCLEQATQQENQRVATYVDIQPGYRYNLKDALAYAVHYVFEHGESISLARTFVRLLCSDRHINELLYELERHGIDPLSVLEWSVASRWSSCADEPSFSHDAAFPTISEYYPLLRQQPCLSAHCGITLSPLAQDEALPDAPRQLACVDGRFSQLLVEHILGVLVELEGLLPPLLLDQ